MGEGGKLWLIFSLRDYTATFSERDKTSIQAKNHSNEIESWPNSSN